MARFGEGPGLSVHSRLGDRVGLWLILASLTSLGCTTFTAVRSADVTAFLVVGMNVTLWRRPESRDD